MRKLEKGKKVEASKPQPVPKSKVAKTVKALRDKHLNDKHHVITDEDIRNLDLETDHPERATSHTPRISRKKNRPKDEDKDPKIVTPWDVVE